MALMKSLTNLEIQATIYTMYCWNFFGRGEGIKEEVGSGA
jgi:hypothetical protein